MSRFPDKIPVPSDVYQKRAERRRQILGISLKGIGLRGAIVVAEIIGFICLQSSALLLDALSSLFDIGISFLLMLCVHLADRPPDRHHPFGHGRFEPIAGLQLGLFLAILGGCLGYQQIIAAVDETSVRVMNPYAWMIPCGAMVLLEMGYRHLKKVAQRQNSPALLADAMHYRIDGLSCALATIALVLGASFPKHSLLLDHLGALFIAVLMVWIGCKAAWDNLDQILDRVPSKEYFQMVHKAAISVAGVLATEKVRIQSYGPDAHVSIDIEVDPALTVEVAHEITQKVRLAIQLVWPAVRDVIVHVEPYYENDHTEPEWS